MRKRRFRLIHPLSRLPQGLPADEEGLPGWAKPQPRIFSVSALTAHLARRLSQDPVLGRTVTVQGELSNVKRSARGHVYLTLRDAESGLSGILWASMARQLPFELENGLEVYVTGHLEVYAPHGTYSLVAERMEPVGIGALQLAFQQIRAQLESEGLFASSLKQALPAFPRRIGIITSRTGAVIHDMLRTIRTKNSWVSVLLHPVPVQGAGAAEAIAAAILECNTPEHDLDILLLARGGGSDEDLFCFNEPAVVRAIAASRVPIVTGIGHEPDYSLADAAADYSAATPTAAADYVTPDARRLENRVQDLEDTLMEQMFQALLVAEQRMDWATTVLTDAYRAQLSDTQALLERRSQQFAQRIREALFHQDCQVQQLAAELQVLSPLATLSRGYAVATDANRHVLTQAASLAPGDRVFVQLSDATLTTEVHAIAPLAL